MKTHINVLAEIIDNLFKLEQQTTMVSEILHLAGQQLMISSSKKKQGDKLVYASKHIRAAFESLQSNINCSQDL